MRRLAFLAFAALLGSSACSDTGTGPALVPDSTLTFDTARARWLAARPSDYSFEFDSQGAWFPSPGFYRATVVAGRLADLRLAATGEAAPLEHGFTIEELWQRMAAARAAGESISDLQFSREGIPIRAMVGSFANDGGVLYRLRGYAPVR